MHLPQAECLAGDLGDIFRHQRFDVGKFWSAGNADGVEIALAQIRDLTLADAEAFHLEKLFLGVYGYCFE
ncbi:hypothetical protein A3197_03395 [Candidatus Thiodiazotropha endoloripes]|nr:hypothetical protein A3197_03395 [Candidatus Thiodiazotropha endoloripes]